MSKKSNTVLILAGLAGLFWALSSRTLAIPGVALSRAKVLALARGVIDHGGFNVDPDMAAAIAEIESSNNPLAIRFEPGIGDASVGLMQTLLGTARWLATDMAFVRFGTPTLADLLDPQVSMYFGAAYLHWLRRYRGTLRDDDWVVMSYNGGPGANNRATREYLAKYKKLRFGEDFGLDGPDKVDPNDLLGEFT